jgi:hypothetical protein
MTPGSANRKLDLLDNFRFARENEATLRRTLRVYKRQEWEGVGTVVLKNGSVQRIRMVQDEC